MIVDLDWRAMRRRLGPLAAEWRDVVVPAEVDVLPDSLYTPAYAWMYAYEKGLRDRIEKALRRPLGRRERDLFGPDTALSETLSNAFVHGHGRDPVRPITVHCLISRVALGFSVRDGGDGFDVEAKLAQVRRDGGYYRMAGNGLRVLVRSQGVEASFEDGGRTANVLCVIGFSGVW